RAIAELGPFALRGRRQQIVVEGLRGGAIPRAGHDRERVLDEDRLLRHYVAERLSGADRLDGVRLVVEQDVTVVCPVVGEECLKLVGGGGRLDDGVREQRL